MISFLRGIAVAAVALSLQSSLGAQAVDPAPAAVPPPAAPEAGPDVLAFEQDRDSRMTVPVSFNGRGPYSFLVDTGAERTVISKELALKLALGPGRSVRMHSMTEVETVATALIPQLEISKKTINDVHAPALSAVNLGAAGMLGVDSLQSQRVTFDFAKKTMTIVPSRKHEHYWGPDTIVITGRSLYGRLVLVDAEIEGQKIFVIMDTGSQISIGNEALRRRLIGRKKLGATLPVQLLSVTGGKLTIDYTTVKKIRIGGVEIANMPIGFADVHPFRQLHLMDRPAFLLGMDVMRLFERVSVDFARREVRFLPLDETSESASVIKFAALAGAPSSPIAKN